MAGFRSEACSEGKEGGAFELGGKESTVDGAVSPGPGERLCVIEEQQVPLLEARV